MLAAPKRTTARSNKRGIIRGEGEREREREREKQEEEEEEGGGGGGEGEGEEEKDVSECRCDLWVVVLRRTWGGEMVDEQSVTILMRDGCKQ